MKVMVTVGLEAKPYDRLLRAVDEAVGKGWIPSDTLVQKGHTSFLFRYCKPVPFLSFDELRDAIRQADLVIAHGGVGSVLLALEMGKIPLVIPRRADFGEHVDNHQIEFVKKMEEEGRVMAAYDTKEFKRVLESREWLHRSMEMDRYEPEITGRLRAILQNCAPERKN
ncbi:MAG: hypothetical protein DRJ08_02245 [Acidobacteria bacterium]|nr:MAG: hypothetical protein DRJ14_06940 [Acidobacteriota bacterium]RLE23630.1 MAG: hypothetical protein DRJ08_02245 [Acidobacteriota bacterium]